ncbi:MAG: lysine--tRNA ligase [Patescibacteria group bacterium]
MSSIDEIRSLRVKKLELLKQKGMDPYPADSRRELSLAEAVANFENLEKSGDGKWLAGRIMSIRGQGAIVFITLNDGTGTFQGLLKKDVIGPEKLNFWSEVVDIGDFVEVQGKFFTTNRGEKTIEVKDWVMLSKSLRPLPEKWHGLQDVEERFRKRYLDALMSAEVKERFITRSKIITELRNIFDTAGYLEVDTPALQPLYGGATAEPFVTHHNALDMQMYLRISDELYLKRMLVAGFPKIYEIARDFRNEGIDMTHNPEFTMVEFYEAYSDADKQMAFVENIFKTLVKKIKGKDATTYEGQEIDFSKKFAVVSYFDLLSKYGGVADPENIKDKDLKVITEKSGVIVNKGDSVAKMLDGIYKKLCRPKLVQPTFIIDYPVEYLPLAKKKIDNPKFVGAFQLVIGGVELVKAFSELNDPLDQRARFEEQEKNKKGGEADAQRLDEDFIESMEYGMPPAGGVGIGIDRLVMFLTDTQNIKEVIFFPTMKPR